LSRELAFALRDLGHELRLISKFDVPGEWQSWPLWGAGKWSSRLQTPCLVAGALAACARDRPDHVISTHVNFGPAARWARKLLGIPYTLIAHGVDIDPELSAGRRAALRGAQRILAVSSWTRERVAKLGIDARRIDILPNTVDEARFSVAPRPERLVQRYALEPGEKVVLTVARLDGAERYKGYDRILRALPLVRAACGAVRFIVAGKGSDRARLEDMAGELGVERTVTFAGFVPDEELADHYRLADVFAMPSTGEGFGIVFLEAMACGTPVLAGNLDGSVDALDGGRLGKLVDPMAIDAIGGGIIALLRREGPARWFERSALHDAVIERFGRAAFRATLRRHTRF
jgi:glycosyltransferase involved in cell wall biosynthesis